MCLFALKKVSNEDERIAQAVAEQDAKKQVHVLCHKYCKSFVVVSERRKGETRHDGPVCERHVQPQSQNGTQHTCNCIHACTCIHKQ